MIKFDNTITLGHVGTAVVYLMVGLGAYYDLKSDVRNTDTTLKAAVAKQELVDQNQDKRLEQIANTFKDQMKENKDDIKAEIRDLRRDVLGEHKR